MRRYKEDKKARAKRHGEKVRVDKRSKSKKKMAEVAAKKEEGRKRTAKCRKNREEQNFPKLSYNKMIAIPPPTNDPHEQKKITTN